MIVFNSEAKKNGNNNYRIPLNIKKISGKRNAQGAINRSTWALIITFISFFLSIIFLLISSRILNDVSTAVAFIVVFIIVLIGVLFDMIGVAVTAADVAPFHSMASKKYIGSKEAIGLIRNAHRVASFCNDVIGDICGVVSGSAGAYIAYRLFAGVSTAPAVEILIGAVIASITVGGKAYGKTFAMHSSNEIVYRVGRIMSFLKIGGLVSTGRKRD